MRNKISRLTVLIFLIIYMFSSTTPAQVRRRSPRAATSQKSNDWTFPRKGMKPDYIAGRSVYSLGDGVAATLPMNSSNGGQHTIVIIAEKTVDEFIAFAEQKGIPPNEFLANGVFGKVCRPPLGVAYIGPKEVGLEISPGTTSTEYLFNTRSGAIARIYIAEDRSSAIVMIDPLGTEKTNEVSSAGRGLKLGRDLVKNRRYTFEELRTSYMGKHRADILEAFGTPYNTYDTGERVAWTYRDLAYDPILGRRKNVTIWFNKHGFVDRISE